MKTFLDSDILIWHLRGSEKARDLLRDLIQDPDTELCIGAMQRAEIVFFMREDEAESTLDLLSLLKTCPVDEAIIDQAGSLYRKWHPSHGIDPNDAILAATVTLHGGRILTLNTSHYPMPGISAQLGWST